MKTESKMSRIYFVFIYVILAYIQTNFSYASSGYNLSVRDNNSSLLNVTLMDDTDYGEASGDYDPQSEASDDQLLDVDYSEIVTEALDYVEESGDYDSLSQASDDQLDMNYSEIVTPAHTDLYDLNRKVSNVCDVSDISMSMFLNSTFVARADAFANCTFLLASTESLDIEIIVEDTNQSKYILMEDVTSSKFVDVSEAKRYTVFCKPGQNLRFYVNTQSMLYFIFRHKPMHNNTYIFPAFKMCSLSTNVTIYDNLKWCSNKTAIKDHVKISCNLKCPGTCNCYLGNRQYHICAHTEQSQNMFVAVPFETHFLNLNHQRINAIRKEAFRDLISLSYLLLENIELREIKPGAFTGLHNLQRLFLRNNLIESLLPGVFRGLSNLVRLYLSGNKLHTLLSGVFSDVPDLGYLILINNFITTISERAFSNMTKLHKLDLSNNSLETLQPRVFMGLTKLSVLAINDNDLSNLSAQVLQDTPYLHRVSIMRNKIRYIDPDTFSGLKNLSEIRLNDNNITLLHNDVLKNLRSLFFLKLQNNNLIHIHPYIWGYAPLIDLNLRGNKLNISECHLFKRLVRLFSMNIEHNGIVNIQSCVFYGMYNIKILKLGHNLIQRLGMDAFQLSSLDNLGLGNNRLTNISIGAFKRLKSLKILDLRSNRLQFLTPGVFNGLVGLKELFLNNNQISEFKVSVFFGTNLNLLNIQQNRIEYLKYSQSKGLENLTKLFLTNNSIEGVESMFFARFNMLEFLDLRANNLHEIDYKSFIGLKNTTKLLVDSHGTCCFVTSGNCTASNKRHPFFNCGSLLPNVVLDIFMWILGFMAITGNLGVLVWRLTHKTRSQKVQWLLITNLAASDFLMGIYMIIIASADNIYGEYFPLHSDHWRFSPACKAAGFLTVVSSEASVFFITFISIDRLLGIEFPFSSFRPGLKRTTCWVTIMWFVAISIGAATSILGGSIPDFYDMSDLCIGLPFVKKLSYETQTINTTAGNWDPSHETFTGFKRNEDSVTSGASFESQSGTSIGMFFSIAIFLGLNFICFIIIAICYCWIFVSVKISTKKSGRRQEREEEIKMAAKMAIIVGTDFCCWMPIIILGILVQADLLIIQPRIVPWIAVFVLPINSSVNPFLYNFKFRGVFKFFRSKYNSFRSSRSTISTRGTKETTM